MHTLEPAMAQVLRGFVFYCVLLLIMSIYFALLPGRRIVPFSMALRTSTPRCHWYSKKTAPLLLIMEVICLTHAWSICRWHSDNQRCRVKQRRNFWYCSLSCSYKMNGPSDKKRLASPRAARLTWFPRYLEASRTTDPSDDKTIGQLLGPVYAILHICSKFCCFPGSPKFGFS